MFPDQKQDRKSAAHCSWHTWSHFSELSRVPLQRKHLAMPVEMLALGPNVSNFLTSERILDINYHSDVEVTSFYGFWKGCKKKCKTVSLGIDNVAMFCFSCGDFFISAAFSSSVISDISGYLMFHAASFIV